MAAVDHDDGEIGFEEGMLLLPSHVLDEVYLGSRHQKHQQRPNKSPGEPQSQLLLRDSKSISRYLFQRTKPSNVEPGMRAIFLGPRHGSCGTGVFFPQRAGTNFQPRKRPACAPVLIPGRVVQALNLDVRALGVKYISPPEVHKYSPRCGEVSKNNSTDKNIDKKSASKKQCNFISQSQTSVEILLPKEWTY